MYRHRILVFNNLMNDDCLSLYIILKHLSWSRYIFLLFVQLWHIHIKEQLRSNRTWQSNISLLSVLTPSNFSRSLFTIGNSPIFIFVFSRESIKSSILFSDENGVLSSGKLAIPTYFNTKNKSARNILSKRCLNTDPWGSINEFPILVRCLLLMK